MEIRTSRFGVIELDGDDTLLFPQGLVGLAECRRWTLVAPAGSGPFAWLQSIDRGDLAMAVAYPRRFVPGYQLRVSGRELASLQLESLDDAQVLCIVGRGDGLALNLKAPLVINVPRRLGRQVVASNDVSVHYIVGDSADELRRSA